MSFTFTQTDKENLKRVVPYLWWALALFVLAVAIGAILGAAHPQAGNKVLDKLGKQFAPLLKMSNIELAGFILFNNLLTTAIMTLLGVFYSVITGFLLIFNAFLVGGVASVTVSHTNIGYTIMSILTHGIFEIPAVLFASALGFELGNGLYWRSRGDKSVDIKQKLKDNFRLFLFIVVPLLIVAAIVEVFVTPIVAGLFLP